MKNEILENINSSLLMEVYKGKYESVAALLELGADVNIRDSKNETPLFLACRNGYKKIVKLLIKNGADVNVENLNSETPLYLTVKIGYKKNSKNLN